MNTNMSVSEERYYYSTKYEITKIVAIILAIFAFFSATKASKLETKVEHLEAQIEETEDWINRNYEDSDNIVYYCEESESHIENMDIDDVINYVEETIMEPVLIGEDAYGFAIYAFQKGYENGRRGIWDEMTKELIDGYEFPEWEADRYLNMLP